MNACIEVKVRISIQFEAQLRHAAGVTKTELTVPNDCCVVEALKIAAEQFGTPLRERLLTIDGSPLRSVLIFVNDHAVSHQATAETCLNDGDALLLFPPISGG